MYSTSTRTITNSQATSAPSDGSRTQLITDSGPREDAGSSSNSNPIGTLRLRGGPRNQQRVAWNEDVVDNEGCGRKSSKICCIYHKPRKFDESSSEEDSDSDSDSSLNIRRRWRHAHNHDHDHDHAHDHAHDHHDHGGAQQQQRPAQSTVVHELDQDQDRNAYEVAPSSKKGKKKDIS